MKIKEKKNGNNEGMGKKLKAGRKALKKSWKQKKTLRIKEKE